MSEADRLIVGVLTGTACELDFNLVVSGCILIRNKEPFRFIIWASCPEFADLCNTKGDASVIYCMLY